MDIRDASDYTLVAELERRGFFSKLARMVEAMPDKDPQTGFLQAAPKPQLGQFIPGTDRKMPVGASSVVEIPDRSNKDGSQLRMITVDGPGVRQEDKPKFILRGSQREEMAQAFIDQWETEVRALETRLETEVLPQAEIENIWAEINRLQQQIALRSTSAFGTMGIEEVRARNEALNGPGSVLEAKSEAGVAGRGVQFTPILHLKEFDRPEIVALNLCPTAMEWAKQFLEPVLRWDPFVLHLPQPVIDRDTEGNLRMLLEPVVVWRALAIIQAACKKAQTPLFDNEVAHAITRAMTDFTTSGHPRPWLGRTDPVADYQRDWTAYLTGNLREVTSDHHYQSLKRTIRIFNTDFQEKEAPDFMFDQGTDGANPEGVERRPHVDPRDAWKEVQEGPGVFRMKRTTPTRTPLAPDDPDEEAND